MIQFLIILVLSVLAAIVGCHLLSARVHLGLAILAVSVGYFPYFWSRTGQTPGMNQMKIKVVRDKDGGPVTVGSAILRFIGLLIGLSVFYLGYIWIFVDKRKRGWHGPHRRHDRRWTSRPSLDTPSGPQEPGPQPRRGILCHRRGGRAVDGGALEKR